MTELQARDDANRVRIALEELACAYVRLLAHGEYQHAEEVGKSIHELTIVLGHLNKAAGL